MGPVQDITQQTTLYISVRTPDKILYDGYADALSSVNEKGTFDILPFHANFICLIKDKIIIHNKTEIKEIKVDNGVLKASKNKVYVLMGKEVK